MPSVSEDEIASSATPQSMILSSPAFAHSANIPRGHTCDGVDKSPALTIAGVPEGTKSLALIVDDPDAPRGTWVHWTLWNISSETREIREGTVPDGAVQGMTNFGTPGYGGPCPPSGTHRYFFKLYALDIELSLPSSAAKADVEEAIRGHILAQTELIGLYSRGN